MNFLSNNTIIKKILISLILIILLTNFVMPNYVQADAGGTLTKPIFQFISWLGNIVIGFLQNTFLGYTTIEDPVDRSYSIYYSPYTIFSGNVPALSINFINPDEDDREFTVNERQTVVGSSGWRNISKSEEFQKDTVVSVVEVLQTYGYKGIDYERLLPTNAEKSNAEETNNENTKEITFENVTHNIDLSELTEDIRRKYYGYETIFKENNGKYEPTDGNWNSTKIALALKHAAVKDSGDKVEEEIRVITSDYDGDKQEYKFKKYWKAISFESNGNTYDLCYYNDQGIYSFFALFNGNTEEGFILEDMVNPSTMDNESLTSKINNIVTINKEQLENPEELLLDYDKLVQDDIFTYKWLLEKAKQGITWTHEGQTYMLTLDYTDDVEKEGAPVIAKYTGTENISLSADLAKELQGTIAKWYKALRTFALVGLLSVLVYIGIRIIIGSSSEDKAKYKKMLASWIAALCIVFILHYIMVFILNITGQITDIFSNNVSNEITRDEAMSYFRTEILKSDDFVNIAAETICYVVLVIYTCVFTIQYLKRVVYMAFLTMIAPLIALTYPLDKIKDGKAQAFSMWLKEYIFNALLQPIHLLLYTILVTSLGVEFIKTNPLYAIVALGFLVPAEKFFRKMFGMESQTSVGAIGAAAGGAMVMSMLNKMKGKPPKEEGVGKGRTVKSKNSNPKFACTN